MFLQMLIFAKKNVGSFYFLAFTFFSFCADVFAIFFISLEIHTDVLFNFYQIFETVVATFLAIEIGKFNPRLKFILYSFCVFFVLSVVLSSFVYNFDFPQDFCGSKYFKSKYNYFNIKIVKLFFGPSA